MNRILLLIDREENRQRLVQQLESHPDILTIEPARPDREEGEHHPSSGLGSLDPAQWNVADLCVVDWPGLERHRQQIQAWKQSESTPDVPVLLTVEPQEWRELHSLEQQQQSPNRIYDDAIAIPLQEEELWYRVEKLSIARSQSNPTTAMGTCVNCCNSRQEDTLGAADRTTNPVTASPSLKRKKNRRQRHIRQNDDLFRLLVEEIRDYAIFLLDSQGRVASWNIGAQRILGYRSEEVIGQHFSCFYPPEDIATGKPEQELQLVATAGQCEDEGWRTHKNGNRFWANTTIAALHDARGNLVGFSAITHDLSDRKAVEMELCSLNRALTTIWECNQVMVRAEKEVELLNEICRIVVETGGYRLAWVALAPNLTEPNPEDPQLLQPVAHAGDADGYLNQIHNSEENSEGMGGLTRISISQGICCVAQNIATDPGFAPWREAALERGLHSTIALPLIGKEKTFGVLRIYSGTANAFDLAEVQLLEELANDLAYGIVALRDRTERQRAEAALAKSEERYRRLVELSPEAILVHSQGTIEFINTAGAKLLGATHPQQLIGKPVMDFVHPDHQSIVRLRLQQILLRQEAVPFVEQQFMRLDGTTVPVELAATPLEEKDGDLNVLAVARDLSDRKRMEAALRASEELHRITLSNISEAVFITDNQGGLTYVSPAVRSIFEYSVTEVQQLGNIARLLGDNCCDRQQLEIVGEIHNLERTITDKSGKTRTLLVSIKQVEIDGGTLLYTCRDISERKQAEVALRESENRFRITFEGASIGMKLIDLDEKFLQTNSALQGMLGYSQQQLQQMSFADITYPEDIPLCRQRFQQLLQGQRDRYQLEKRYIRVDGSLMWVRLSVSAIRDTQGALQFAIGLVEDITERKQAEEELRLYRNHLEELVAERTAELSRTNQRLQQEIQRREQAQQALIRVTQAVESTSDAVVTLDITGRAIYQNRAFLELFECSVEALNSGGGLPLLFADPEFGKEVFQTIRQGNSWSGEVRMCRSTSSASILPIPGQLNPTATPISIWLRADAVTDDNQKRVGSICVLTDISERKQAEAALRESEEQLRTLIDAMPDAICFKDDRGAWLEANQAMLQLFQLEGVDYRGKKDSQLAAYTDFYHAALFECEKTDEQTWQDGSLAHAEEIIPRPDGLPRIFDAIKVPLFHTDGTRKGLVVIGRDITDRKQTEEERLRLASIVESSDDAIIGKTLEGIILSWNAGAESIYGYSAEEIKGRSVSILVLPNRLTSELQLLERIQQGASIDRYETVHLKKDGSQIYVSLTVSPIKDAAGRVTGISTIARDITDLKRVEYALERLRHQNESILNSAGEGICGMDASGNTTFVNPAATKMLDYSMSALLGVPLAMILEPPQSRLEPENVDPHRTGILSAQNLLNASIYAAIADGAVHSGTTVFWRKDGSSFPVEYISTPIQEQNRIVGAVLTFKDITERLAVERMKDEFISVVSHELRTPLTSIRGSLGLLAGGLLTAHPQKAQRMLQIAVTNTDRLVRLINDILDLERIGSGKVTMVNQYCNSAELMVQAAEAMRSMADKAGIAITLNPIQMQLSADPDRIFQVLTNLLSNAIKFSPEGATVRLSSSVISEAVNTTHPHLHREILFHIQDCGRGIPVDKLESIFERFQQVDASDSRKKGGTGLGLAICRSIVEHHGGRIWAESAIGEGSSFYFTLPLDREPLGDRHRCDSDPDAIATSGQGNRTLVERPRAAAPDTAAPSSPSDGDAALSSETKPSPPLILIADDRATDRRFVQTLVERGGYRAISVASGEEAIALAARLSPALILIDLSSKGVEGWQTMVSLKECAETRQIPAILFSSRSPVSESVSDVTPLSGWVCQPMTEGVQSVAARELFQDLDRGLGRLSQIRRVLVVEDDPVLAQVLLSTFEAQGIETFHACNGASAIALSQQVLPDLVVLNLVLPACDGFAVVDWLRQHDRLACISLVVYSAIPLDTCEREQLTLGQTEFLARGSLSNADFERQIVGLVNRIIEQRR